MMRKASDVIKNCPFCGSTADIWLSENRLLLFVECDNVDCGARGGSDVQIDQAIRKWNIRNDKEERK